MTGDDCLLTDNGVNETSLLNMCTIFFFSSLKCSNAFKESLLTLLEAQLIAKAAFRLVGILAVNIVKHI